MAHISYKDTDFQHLLDQKTLCAVFKVACQTSENLIVGGEARMAETIKNHPPGTRFDNSYRTSLEKAFNNWIETFTMLTHLPDLDKVTMTRVITPNLIEGAHRLSMHDNETPMKTLSAMKTAVSKSPRAVFFTAAIEEMEGEYRGKTWPERSVAETEYRIIDTQSTILSASRYLNRGTLMKDLKRDTLHPKKYQNWDRTIAGFEARDPAGIPPTLYKQAQDAVEKLRVLKAGFKPA